MSNYSQENYEIEYCWPTSSDANPTDYFGPSLQSLKSAQDIISRYEKKRRAVAERDRQNRGIGMASPTALDMGFAVGDNIVLIRSRVWARPSSRLSRSRHNSQPYTLSPATRARRVSPKREALRAARHLMASTPWPTSAAAPVIWDGVQSDLLERLGVMAVQGLAVILGFGGLLALLKLF